MPAKPVETAERRGRTWVVTTTMAWILLSFLCSLPVAMSQGNAPPHLSPEDNTLWAHGDTSQSRSWMNADENDGVSILANTDNTELGLDEEFQFVFELDPPLNRTIVLDPDETIDINVYIGSDGGAADIAVSTRIMLGDQLVAAGAPQFLISVNQLCSGFLLRTWHVSPEITELDAGEDLVWIVEGSGTWVRLFVGTSDSCGYSNIELPILSVRAPAQSRNPVAVDEVPIEVANETEAANVTATAADTAPSNGPVLERTGSSVVPGVSSVLVLVSVALLVGFLGRRR